MHCSPPLAGWSRGRVSGSHSGGLGFKPSHFLPGENLVVEQLHDQHGVGQVLTFHGGNNCNLPHISKKKLAGAAAKKDTFFFDFDSTQINQNKTKDKMQHDRLECFFFSDYCFWQKFHRCHQNREPNGQGSLMMRKASLWCTRTPLTSFARCAKGPLLRLKSISSSTSTQRSTKWSHLWRRGGLPGCFSGPTGGRPQTTPQKKTKSQIMEIQLWEGGGLHGLHGRLAPPPTSVQAGEANVSQFLGKKPGNGDPQVVHRAPEWQSAASLYCLRSWTSGGESWSGNLWCSREASWQHSCRVPEKQLLWSSLPKGLLGQWLELSILLARTRVGAFQG